MEVLKCLKLPNSQAASLTVPVCSVICFRPTRARSNVHRLRFAACGRNSTRTRERSPMAAQAASLEYVGTEVGRSAKSWAVRKFPTVPRDLGRSTAPRRGAVSSVIAAAGCRSYEALSPVRSPGHPLLPRRRR